ncbi:MAG: hypothetical protein AAF741_18795 [Bacteroidota bacterium]
MTKPLESQDFKKLVEWVKKNFNESYTVIAEKSNIPFNRMVGLRRSSVTPKPEDFIKLSTAYPILRDRVRELGIEPDPKTEADLAHLSEAQANELIAKMRAELEPLIEQYKEISEQLKQSNQREQLQRKMIERLLSELEEKEAES